MNHATTHLIVARLCNDPVATATTDGKEMTDEERNDLINQATLFLIQHVLFADPDRKASTILFESLKKQATFTWASAGTTLISIGADYLEWIEVAASITGERLGFEPFFTDLSSGHNPFQKNAFSIKDQKIFGYADGALLNAGTGVLLYFESSQAATSAAATINLDLRWQFVLAELTAYFFFAQKGDVTRADFFFKNALAGIQRNVDAAAGKATKVR